MSLQILQHALGLDEYGQGRVYRRHFVASGGSDDFNACMQHVKAGRMERHEPRAPFGGATSYCFVVTAAGEAYARHQSPKPPNLTRGQKRYQAYLRQDSPLTFGDWLRAGYWRPI